MDTRLKTRYAEVNDLLLSQAMDKYEDTELPNALSDILADWPQEYMAALLIMREFMVRTPRGRKLWENILKAQRKGNANGNASAFIRQALL